MSSTVLNRYYIAVAAATLIFACGRDDRATQSRSGSGTSQAPSGEAAASRDNALVRFVNAHAAAAPADLVFGDQKAFTSVDYKTVTPYKELPGERRELKLIPAGQPEGAPVATNNEGLMDGKRYTVIAVQREDGKPALTTVADDMDVPADGKAKLRVIHAAANTGDLDVRPAGKNDPIFDGVDFNSATGYREVDPATTALEVRKDGENRPVLTIPNLTLAAGKLYTVIVTGTNGRLEAIHIEDQLM